MFRRHPEDITSVLASYQRERGFETPLLQRRVLAMWESVAGPVVARYTESKQIKNQTLWVKVLNPAVRADLQMRRSDIVRTLNNAVGAQIIVDIRVY